MNVPQVRPCRVLRFGVFEVNLSARELRKHGVRIRLSGQPFCILAILLDRPGEVVAREEIRSKLWNANTFVDFEHSLNSAVKKLRRALGDSPVNSRYIETVPRLGYRFVAPVEEVSRTEAPATPAPSLTLVPENPAKVDKRHTPLWPMLLAISAVVIAVGYFTVGYFQRRSEAARPQPSRGRVMLAVLPFENLSGDASQDYFSDGLTEEMITQIGRLDPQNVGVVGRTSVMRYKGGGREAANAGRELGVQYILEGSVRREGDQVRITAQLIQTRDQTHLWAGEYDRELNHLLAVQAEIAASVADQIQLTVGSDRRFAATERLASHPRNPRAYDHYLKGLYFWNKRTSEGLREAVSSFQRATIEDPQFASAFVGLADAYAMMSINGLGPPSEYMPRARAAALTALQIDDTSAGAHTALALISEHYDWDWNTANQEFQRAIALDPNYAVAHHWFAECLAFEGRMEEAMAESGRALQLDPLSLIIASDNGAILYFAHEYDRAIQRFSGVLDLDPTFGRAHLIVGAYVEQGRTREALALIKEWRRSGDGPWIWDWQAFVFGRAGERAKAEHAVRRLRESCKAWRLDPTPFLAHAYAGMKDPDNTMLYLEEAYRKRSDAVAVLKVDPAFAPMSSDPRFQDLLRRVHLSE